MTFQDVAIDDGCVAGLKRAWNVVRGLDLLNVGGLFGVNSETAGFQVLVPAFTAASARRLVDVDRRQATVVRRCLQSQRRAQSEDQYCE
jgi:hypothetical protein